MGLQNHGATDTEPQDEQPRSPEEGLPQRQVTTAEMLRVSHGVILRINKIVNPECPIGHFSP